MKNIYKLYIRLNSQETETEKTKRNKSFDFVENGGPVDKSNSGREFGEFVNQETRYEL